MTRPHFALPNVSDEAVEAILKPVQAQAALLAQPHSIITAREVLNRLWFVMHDAQAQLTAADLEAARNHAAEMREEYA